MLATNLSSGCMPQTAACIFPVPQSQNHAVGYSRASVRMDGAVCAGVEIFVQPVVQQGRLLQRAAWGPHFREAL